MNDTTSTPDDPDRADAGDRGVVATGGQSTAARRADAASVVGATGRGPTDGAGPNGAVGGGATTRGATAASRPSPRTDGADGVGNGQQPGSSGPTEADRVAGLTTGEAPTAQLRLQTGPNGTRSGRDDGVTRPAGSTDPTVTVAPHPPTHPAQRQAPGPDPASPPPWQRVPGRGMTEPMRSGPSPAGGLLDDEGPTAFLEAPPRPGEVGGPAGVAPDAAPQRPGGLWSTVPAVRSRPPRRAALQLKRLDPWSVLKLALVLAVVLFLIWLVAVGVLYGVLNGLGVWDRLNGTYADLVSGSAPTGSPLISAGRVFGIAAVVGAINSLLFAVALTVGAFVYNVSADLVGGIEVTLSERD